MLSTSWHGWAAQVSNVFAFGWWLTANTLCKAASIQKSSVPKFKDLLELLWHKSILLDTLDMLLCSLLDMNMHNIIHMLQAIQSNMRQESLTPPQVWVGVCFE